MIGYTQLYTGKGKGKTTAALGLALRAAGAGLHVFIGQFLKGGYYSELESIKRFSDCITLQQFGRQGFFKEVPFEENLDFARHGLTMAKEIIGSKKFHVVILDEINVAVSYKLLTVEAVLELVEEKPRELELVLTGRYADPRLIEAADLVTEMLPVKHYAKTGVEARIGIEK
jgi:cob(I)alamin adenosyltransferase